MTAVPVVVAVATTDSPVSRTITIQMSRSTSTRPAHRRDVARADQVDPDFRIHLRAWLDGEVPS